MKNRTGILTALSTFFLLISRTLFADVITPLSVYTLPIFIPIVLVEAGLFLLWARRILKSSVGFWWILLAVLIANLVTSLVGTLIPMSKYLATNLIWIGVAFVLSVILEWVVYIPFMKKRNFGASNLLKISLVVNFATYAIIAMLFISAGDYEDPRMRMAPSRGSIVGESEGSLQSRNRVVRSARPEIVAARIPVPV